MLLAQMPKRSFYDLLSLLCRSMDDLQKMSCRSWATPPDRHNAVVLYESLRSAYDVLKVLEDELTFSEAEDDSAGDADADGSDQNR